MKSSGRDSAGLFPACCLQRGPALMRNLPVNMAARRKRKLGACKKDWPKLGEGFQRALTTTRRQVFTPFPGALDF